MVLVYFPRPSSALVLGSQHHPVSLLMINALSLSVLLLETNLELDHAGDREQQNRQHQKFTFFNSLRESELARKSLQQCRDLPDLQLLLTCLGCQGREEQPQGQHTCHHI